jgi:hypothetical protein
MTDQHGENPSEPLGEGSPPPDSSATPPPAAPAHAGGPQSGLGGTTSALQDSNPLDLGMVAAGVIAFIASMLPYYTASVSAGGFSASGHASAWHGFFGWFAALVALATAVLVALPLFKVNVSLPLSIAQTALIGFGVALVCTLLALFIFPGGASCSDVNGLGITIHCDTGRGFGYWLMLLAVIAGTVLAFLRGRETMAKTA